VDSNHRFPATVSLSNLDTIHCLRERELMLHPGLPLSLGAALNRTEAGLCADLTCSLKLLPDNCAPGWQGLALAPSGGSVTRHGYHCRGQPGSAHGKPAVIGRQKPAVAPGQFAGRKRYRRNVSLNSRNHSFESASLQRRVRERTLGGGGPKVVRARLPATTPGDLPA
jgi:hypothetical protein